MHLSRRKFFGGAAAVAVASVLPPAAFALIPSEPKPELVLKGDELLRMLITTDAGRERISNVLAPSVRRRMSYLSIMRNQSELIYPGASGGRECRFDTTGYVRWGYVYSAEASVSYDAVVNQPGGLEKVGRLVRRVQAHTMEVESQHWLSMMEKDREDFITEDDPEISYITVPQSEFRAYREQLRATGKYDFETHRRIMRTGTMGYWRGALIRKHKLLEPYRGYRLVQVATDLEHPAMIHHEVEPMTLTISKNLDRLTCKITMNNRLSWRPECIGFRSI